MIDWSALTLFLYMTMRMAGFVLFSPIFARSGVPTTFRTGLIMLFSLTAYAAYDGNVTVPTHLLELAFRLLAEMGIGLALNFVLRFFLFIPEQAGDVVDTQMGMSMGRSYDPSSQSSMTVSASILSMMMLMLFFVANGHVTLIRLMLTSGEILPFGSVTLGQHVADRVVALFAECMLLAVKMSLPILGAELLGQVGMGILMKAIPQINVFAINIELKVIVGMVMLSLLLSPISSFMLEAESYMLRQMQLLMEIAAGG